ncbi:unnamed protein product [Cylicocyclus nassatus]|uniref:Uncharacterized protein n=1 Tax=Cylicocyclus nassatus TaxID=53992 RepID=A0AA36GJP7_CYLNA|nr:unnamed protein product [Cylicocyclus nassatus]
MPDIVKDIIKAKILSLLVVSNTFEAFGLFEEWLKKKENETCSKVVRCYVRKSSSGNTYVYLCHQARGKGEDIDPEEFKQRYMQHKRIKKHCPCFVKAHLNGLGTVHVTACFGHYGHAISMAALPLSNEDEGVVKNLIEAEVPARTIVSKLRRENWNSRQDPERQMRLCYLTTTDISNIAERHHLIKGNTCDDRTSVKTLVENEDDIAASKLIETNNLSGTDFY